jgi:hypothetical protein
VPDANEAFGQDVERRVRGGVCNRAVSCVGYRREDEAVPLRKAVLQRQMRDAGRLGVFRSTLCLLKRAVAGARPCGT